MLHSVNGALVFGRMTVAVGGSAYLCNVSNQSPLLHTQLSNYFSSSVLNVKVEIIYTDAVPSDRGYFRIGKPSPPHSWRGFVIAAPSLGFPDLYFYPYHEHLDHS